MKILPDILRKNFNSFPRINKEKALTESWNLDNKINFFTSFLFFFGIYLVILLALHMIFNTISILKSEDIEKRH